MIIHRVVTSSLNFQEQSEIIRIFIVEDEPTLQLIYKEILNAAGFQVIDTASNGIEAVDKFREFAEKPEIILMDHRMPRNDGLEATKEILQLSKASQIIFVSADIGVREMALALGVMAFLAKPFSLESLLNLIKQTCHQ